jgi:hypothetical protein
MLSKYRGVVGFAIGRRFRAVAGACTAAGLASSYPIAVQAPFVGGPTGRTAIVLRCKLSDPRDQGRVSI